MVMKSIKLLLIFLLPFSLFAQVPTPRKYNMEPAGYQAPMAKQYTSTYLLDYDSSFSSDSIGQNAVGQDVHRHEYLYDSSGRLLCKKQFVWIFKWEPEYKDTTTYDSNGYITMHALQQWDTTRLRWKTYLRLLYTYRDNYRIKEVTHQNTVNADSAVNDRKFIYYFNVFGTDSLAFEYFVRWPISNVWINDVEHIHFGNKNYNDTLELINRYDTSYNTYSKNYIKYRNSFENNHLTRSIELYWNINNKVWNIDGKDSFTFNSSGQLTEHGKYDYFFSSKNFGIHDKLTYDYNSSGIIALQRKYGFESAFSNSLIIINQSKYLYDANDLLDTMIYYDHYNTLSPYTTTIYHLKKTSVITRTQQEHSTLEADILVYPNPATDVLHVRLDNITIKEKVSMALYNMQGQEVYVKEDKANTGYFSKEIDMRNLPKGVYFLKISGDTKQFINKVVK
jgi:hypothetical protein